MFNVHLKDVMLLMNIIIINLFKTCFFNFILFMYSRTFLFIYHSLIPNYSNRQHTNVFDVYPLLICIMLKYMSFFSLIKVLPTNDPV